MSIVAAVHRWCIQLNTRRIPEYHPLSFVLIILLMSCNISSSFIFAYLGHNFRAWITILSFDIITHRIIFGFSNLRASRQLALK